MLVAIIFLVGALALAMYAVYVFKSYTNEKAVGVFCVCAMFLCEVVGVLLVSMDSVDRATPKLGIGERGTVVAIYDAAEPNISERSNANEDRKYVAVVSQYFLVRLADGRDARIPDTDFVSELLPNKVGTVVFRVKTGVIFWTNYNQGDQNSATR